MVKGQVPPNWAWAKGAGGSGDDVSNGIATDAAGNTYITGGFSSPTISFGATTLTNNGGGNVYITKYDANGNVIWAKSAGGIYSDHGSSIAIDAAGNTYITGGFSSPTITYGATTLTNNSNNIYSDIFIAKYDVNGNVLWVKSSGGTSDDEGESIALDAAGNAYITGYFQSPTITFGATTLTNIGNYNTFITKYDTNGNVIWAKSSDGSTGVQSFSIASDASGNTTITGFFYNASVTFGTTTLTNNGLSDIFIVKYDTNGNVIWAKSSGGTSDDWGYSIVMDAAGNAYITGEFGSSAVIFGATTLTNNGGGDILIAKYDTNGNEVWAKSAGGSGDEQGYSIATDLSGSTYITGYFRSPAITFGATTLTNNAFYDLVIAKYDTNGNVVWASSIGGSSNDYGSSIATNATGYTCVTGYFLSSSITFGATTITNADITGGSYDVFIAKLNATTGIAEMENNAAIVISPNPFSNYTTITLPSTQQPATIILTDILGKEIRTIPHVRDRQVVIEKGEMKPGIYFLTLTTQAGVENRKIVVE